MKCDDIKDQLTADEYDLVRHGYGRKCSSWDETDASVDVPQAVADKIGVCEFEDDSSPMDDLPGSFKDSVFIARLKNGQTYLVNTEGFGYARYIARANITK